MTTHDADEALMRHAIRVAGGNPAAPFGAVLADPADGVVLAEGLNKGHLSPTFHGEIDLINTAAGTVPGRGTS